MGMVVRSNIMAVNSQRQLGMNNSQVSKALEKLSSGYRINRAGDDASGLAISEKMKAQIKGLDTASLNAQDGISVVQTAEGALTEVHNMLNRMVELATRSANGINADLNRESLQQEVDKLKEEIASSYLFANATGMGMKPLEGQTYIPDKSFFRPDLIVTDVVYSPRETAMLKMAKEVGCKTMNGMGMMLFQGAAAFEMWTGKEMPIDHMKQVLDIKYD